jgi:hypothetical protein
VQAVVSDPCRVSFSVLRRRLRIVAPEAELDAGPIDPVVQISDGVVRYGDAPIEPRRGGVYGVAVDLGTTTIVLELVDLLDGRTLEVVALENPQRFGGSDVINRISYDEADPGSELRHAVRRALNRELGDLYARASTGARCTDRRRQRHDAGHSSGSTSSIGLARPVDHQSSCWTAAASRRCSTSPTARRARQPRPVSGGR